MKDKTFLIITVFILFIIFLVGNSLGLTGEVSYIKYCADSDNGLTPYTPGMVASHIGNFNDRCLESAITGSKKSIREYFCVEGRFGGIYKVDSRIVECGPGYICSKDVLDEADSCIKI